MADLWLGKHDDTRVAIDADALTTHGVCVGMTGSGKTGLCVGLLEEVANAGVPILAIDPKGDLTNLAILEPDAANADSWRAGQAKWGIDGAAVRAWGDKVAVRVWTPGSDAGLGVNVLAALRRPAGELDDETRRELVLGSVSALLGLVGEAADPVRSPAHIVLSRILEEAWARGDDPDLEQILAALVDPPFAKVGIFPTDKFFKPDARMDLAMRLNALIASPAFASWASGAALDVPALVAPVDGKTPINVFTLSHLSEQERHFFVGILLDRVAAWSRTLPGTNKLRALVFFDEVWGYLPPHPKDPPAKRPLLALMKQARAVGVSTVLATQNPVDLDYKALSNAGTWFVGRLQTRNDRDRVAEGLTAAGMDRSDAEAMLDKVGPRRFVLQQAGKGAKVFDTRWTRVFLAGPLTRPQIRQLVESGATAPAPVGGRGAKASSSGSPLPAAADRRQAETASARPASVPPSAVEAAAAALAAATAATARAAVATPAAPAAPRAAAPTRAPAAPAPAAPPRAATVGVTRAGPSLEPPIFDGDQWMLDPRVVFSARFDGAFLPWAEPHGDVQHLRPALAVELSICFDEEKAGYVDLRREWRVWFPLDDALPLAPLVLPIQEDDLREQLLRGLRYDPLPGWLDEPKEVDALVKSVVARVVAEETQGMWANPTLKLHGRPGETRAQFDERCRAAVEDRVEEALAGLREGFEKKSDALEEKIRRLEEKRDREAQTHASRQTEEWMNVGETVLSFFTGRKKSITTVATKRRQTVAAEQRVSAVDSELAASREAVYALEEELERKVAELRERESRALGATTEREIRLERDDVRVLRRGILWIPVGRRL